MLRNNEMITERLILINGLIEVLPLIHRQSEKYDLDPKNHKNYKNWSNSSEFGGLETVVVKLAQTFVVNESIIVKYWC